MIANRHKLPINAKSFAQIQTALIGFLESAYGLNPGELEETELLALQIDMTAMLGDAFFREAERAAGEGSLATAIEPQNILDLALNDHGYTPSGVIAAEYTMELSADAGVGFIIPKYARFQTEPADGSAPQYFEAVEDVIKPLGVEEVEFTVRHGITRFEGPYSAAGTPLEAFVLGLGNVVTDSVRVVVNGGAWTKVRNFSQSLPTSRHYRLLAQETTPGVRKYLVQFGDGVLGRKLTPLDAVEMSYLTAAGRLGNVGLGTITRRVDETLDGLGTSITVGWSNTAQTQRGRDQESIDVVRVKAPMLSAIHGGVVSTQDYARAAIQSGLCERARAYTRAEIPTLIPNVVVIYVVTDLEAVPSESTCTTIAEGIVSAFRANGTAAMSVVPAQFEEVTLNITCKAEPGASALARAALMDTLQTLCESFFSLASVCGPLARYTVDIGTPIPLSPLITLLSEFQGVDSVELPDTALTALTPTSRNNLLRVTPSVLVVPFEDP